MNDDSMVKIMQSLGLDYNPAISSTIQFQKTIGDLNKQLEVMKTNAMQSAKDINNAFSSNLGQAGGNKTIVDQYGNAFKTAKQEARETSVSVSRMAKDIKESALEQMKAQVASVQQRVATKGLSQEYAQQAGTLREQLSAIQARLQAEGKLTAEEVKQTNQLKEQLEILRAQTRTAVSDDIRENPSTFGEEWERRSSWFLSGAMFYGTINAAKEAQQTIKDVEMGMIEIARVMQDTSFVFDDYRDNLFQLGVNYGQTFENVQSIALRWSQSGYNVADSLKLTETSLLALNTAELDATQATEAMIGIMSQWQLQAEDLALVMDKVNLTADRNAITSQDLVDGLLRSSSAARNMNMELDETIALLTVMREASGRTGKEVGNALNSILSYITRGKSIDTLESLGIQMFTDSTETQFRNAMDIFKDIHDSWDSLSMEIQDGFVKSADEAGLFNEEMANALGIQEEWNDVQKRDASQASAGVHRRNYFIGMIERMSNTQGILNDLLEAEGYSMRENADTMESLEKKQQSLKASVEALAVAIGDAGLEGVLKGLVDAGTGALNFINNLDKFTKNFILSALTAFTAVKTLELGMKTFGIQLPGISQMITALTSGTWNLVTVLKAGASGIGAFVAANGPLLALSASVGLIIALANAEKKRKEELAKAIETSKENIESLKEQKQGLQELSKEYDTLKAKEQNLTANIDEKARLKEIQKELVDLYDVSITGIDAEGQAYSDSAEAIRDKIRAMEEERAFEESKLETAVKADDDQRIKDLERNFKERERLARDMVDVSAEITRLENALASRSKEVRFKSELGDMITWDASTDSGQEALSDQLSVLNFNLGLMRTANEEINTAIQEGTQNAQNYLRAQARDITQQLSENGTVITDGMRLYIDGVATSLSQAPRTIYKLNDELEDAIKKFVSSDFAEWEEKYKKAVSEGDTKGIDEASKAISGLTEDFIVNKEELGEFTPLLNDLALSMASSFGDSNAIKDTTTAVFDLQTSLKNMGSTTKDTLGELKLLNQSIHDIEKGQSLSIDTILELSDTYGLNLEAVEQTTKGYTVEISTLEDLRKAKTKTALDGMEAERQLAETVKGQVESRLTNYGLEIEQLKDLTEARAIMAGQARIEAGSKAREVANEATGGHSDSGIRNAIYSKAYNEAYERHMAGVDADLAAYEKALSDIEAVETRAKTLKGMLEDSNYGVSPYKAPKDKESRYENKQLEEALKFLEHRKRISEESQASIRAELEELKRINSLYVKTNDERMNMAERLYSTEKRLRDRTLQDSVNFISEKKNFNEMSAEDEIKAWERVRDNQVSNINAVKQANLELYRLRNQLAQDSYNKEENTIKHLTKLGVLSAQQQIAKYRELYEVKVSSLAEEQSRVENLFSLYNSLIKEQQQKTKDAYDKRIEQIEDEAKRKKSIHEDEIKAIEKELDLLNRDEQEYDHDKKMDDLKEQLAYWQVRTSEDARKKVIDLLKQIDEAEHKRKVELQRQSLEDRKKTLQDEVTAVDDTAREERDKLDKSYKRIETAFDSHSTNIVALASTMSKEAYNEWLNNYIIPLQNALADNNFSMADSLFDGLDDFIGGMEGSFGDYGGGGIKDWGGASSNSSNQTSNSNNAQIYNLANSIANLKREYALGINPDAPLFTKPLYEQLSKLNPTISEYLRNNDYIKAADYVKDLPKMHKGGKSLSYGAVEMMPGELTFPPDLSVGLERLFPLLSNLAKTNLSTGDSSVLNDKRVIQNFNSPLFHSEKTVFEDDVDERSFSRELQRQISNMV